MFGLFSRLKVLCAACHVLLLVFLSHLTGKLKQMFVVPPLRSFATFKVRMRPSKEASREKVIDFIQLSY